MGTSLAYFLGSRFEGNIAVVEREDEVARHASGRNTGVIHRPFYLHPQQRRLFARTASLSYPFWKEYAFLKGLPWAETGTLKVALSEDKIKSLEKNMEYAKANGMDPSELELLDSRETARMEPEVRCVGALLIKTDTTCDFGSFTRSLRQDAESMGVRFITRREVVGVDERGGDCALTTALNKEKISTHLTVNCAGGNAIDVAHLFGLAGSMRTCISEGNIGPSTREWRDSRAETSIASPVKTSSRSLILIGLYVWMVGGR